jgi:hypothetical protein
MTWGELRHVCKEYGVKCNQPPEDSYASIFIYTDSDPVGYYFCVSKYLCFKTHEDLVFLIFRLTFC